MALNINTNVASLNAQRSLMKSSDALAGSLQRLSSGLRINTAKDDAAGLAIATRFTAQIRGLEQASRNANDAISLSQVAEGALDQMTSMLQRIRELAVQSATGSNSASDRAALDAEVQQLSSEITRVAEVTSFNGIEILNGNFAAGKSFHIGSEADDGNQTISFSVDNMRSDELKSYSVVIGGGAANGADGLDVTVAGDTNAGLANGSARLLAAAMNDLDEGFRASANNNVKLDFDTNFATVTQVTINNKTANWGAGTDVAGMASALNSALQGTTQSVQVNDTNDGLIIRDSLGENLDVTVTGDSYTLTNQDVQGASAIAGADGATVSAYGAVTAHNKDTFSTGVEANMAFLSSKNGAAATLADQTVLTDNAANSTIAVVDSAIATINDARANLGAVQNRFQATVSGLATTLENLNASRGRITDADFAAESAKLTRNQILQQAGTAMLAQANSLPQAALSLLQ
jgi:flagellin